MSSRFVPVSWRFAVALAATGVGVCGLVLSVARTPPATPDAVARLVAGGRFDAAADVARALVRQQVAAVGRPDMLTATTWDPLLQACLAAVRAGNPRCVDWALAELAAPATGAGDEQGADFRPALAQLAELLTSARRFPEAERAYERLIDIDARRFGRPSLELSTTIIRMGEFYRVAMGDLARARDRFAEAVEMREALFGPESSEVGRGLHNVGMVVADLEGYDEALALHSRGLAMVERTAPPDDLRLAAIIDYEGVLRRNVGELTRARELHERARGMRERKLGPDSVPVAGSLVNLSLVFAELGDKERALATAGRALAIYESTLGDHPNTVETALNVAGYLASLGRPAEAAARYRQALGMIRSIRGPDDPAIGDVLQRMASLDLAGGRLDAAAERFRESIQYLDHDQQRNSRALANALAGLGQVALARRRPAVAAPYLERSLALRRERHGTRHPLMAESLLSLARQRRASGDQASALDLALQAETVSRSHLRLMARALREREALRYAAARPPGLDLALALVAEGRAANDTERVWTALVRSRALVLDEMGRRGRARASGDEALAAAGAALARAREELATLTLRSLRDDLPAPAARRLVQADAGVDRLEREVARLSGTGEGVVPGADLPAIAAHLPAGAALVAYAVYREPGDGGAGRRRYVAFVLDSADARPVAVDLGDAEVVDGLVTAWKTAAGEPAPVFTGGAARVPRIAATGTRLRQAVWDPVAGRVGSADTVLIVPAGTLHLLSFATLPAGDGRYLLETGPTLHYLSAERDLLDRARALPRPRRLLAFGGPDFERDPTPLGAGAPAVPGRLRGASADCVGQLQFEPLPKAADEVRGIATLWRARHGAASARLLVGAAASEAALKAMGDPPDVLHLATHTFFLEDRCVRPADDRDGDVPISPLALAGLAFAGANRGAPSDGTAGGDGMLTAAEIASLDLSRTRWVVLSACDTGGGTIQDGEGVLGVRRAFRAAGARTLVMSLWRVGDEAAMQWMRRFYRHLLDGDDTPRAVRAASLDILSTQRAAGRDPGPAAWGAFVAAGDWR